VNHTRFEVSVVKTKKTAVFRDVTLHSVINLHRGFTQTCCPYDWGSKCTWNI